MVKTFSQIISELEIVICVFIRSSILDANQMCEMEDRGCEFKCNNDGKGSYFCSCDKGFGLNSDHKTCKGSIRDFNCYHAATFFFNTFPIEYTVTLNFHSFINILEVYDPDRFVYSSITIHWVKGWSNARKQCFSRGGDLISITSSEEQAYVNNVVLNKMLRDYALWIGLNDRNRNGDWVWADGSVVNYTNWVSSRNDAESSKHCGVQVNEAWRPMLCGSDKVYNYVCKRKSKQNMMFHLICYAFSSSEQRDSTLSQLI